MPNRWMVLAVSLVTAFIFILLLNQILPADAGRILLDNGETGLYPFSIQNAMWLAFFIGLGECFLHTRSANLEEDQIKRHYLPEDDSTVLKAGDDLADIYRTVKASRYRDRAFLPRVVERCILQYNMSKSVDQTNSLLNSSMEMFMHEIDLRYNMIRYITWLIPSLGFIGTVLGIMLALQYAGDTANQGDDLLFQVAGRLGVAFTTTLVALVMAAVLVLIQNIVQAREERALNKSGQYCLDNLINRLYQA